mmetsp:Transcript_55399/g.161731  ORF Transcript_55399/g.161731 Transcript_55399/m.161731 type:complete len:448 (-) Transcript_55399:100-1443(-)
MTLQAAEALPPAEEEPKARRPQRRRATVSACKWPVEQEAEVQWASEGADEASARPEPLGDAADGCRRTDAGRLLSWLDKGGLTIERRKWSTKTCLMGAAGHRKNMHMYMSDPGISPEEAHALSEDPADADGHSSKLSSSAPSGGPGTAAEDRTPSSSSVLKKLDEHELTVYFELWHIRRDDPVLAFVPRFHGMVEETDGSGVSSKYLRMENLLHSFRPNARVMDVKLGVRTYLEAECSNTARRPDLYTKMKDAYPWELTEAEHEAQAVTKYRWMSVHDANTTSPSLGFRLDGVAGYSKTETEELRKAFWHIRLRAEAARCLQRFAEDAASPDGDGPRKASPGQIARDLASHLKALREALQASEFFYAYECIGSSALLVADADGKVGAFWIDFAKARRVPVDLRISHRAPWVQGTHEDGVLTGVDNLVALWEEVADDLDASVEPFERD